MKDSLHNLTSLVTTLAQTIQALQKDQEKAAKDIAAKGKLYNELLAQNAEFRDRINAVYQDASATHWSGLPKPSNTVVIGSSIIRDIDDTKLINTQCICVSGGKIDDIRKKGMEFPTTSKLARAILVVGGNDCDSQLNQCDASELVAQYKDLILSAKEIATAVTVSSVCPRRRSLEVTERIGAVNAGLSVLCDEMGVSFINNDRSFYLQDDTVNYGYLLPDGVHLTKPATNKLVANLKLQLRHGEPSAHADHRRWGHPEHVAGPRGSSGGRVERNVQLPQSSTPFQRAPQSHFTKSKRHPQPPRATPSMQPAASPGATTEGREQGTQPWQHWEQQRHQRRRASGRRWKPSIPDDHESQRPVGPMNSRMRGQKQRDNSRNSRNYRPVSVLPILSKVYETVMNDQLFGYFLDKFHEFLSAFRKRYSCQSLLLKAVDDWKYALDQNLKTGVVLWICRKRSTACLTVY